MSNQIYIVTFTNTQLTQASFLQKNQMLQNGFLISVTLKTLIFASYFILVFSYNSYKSWSIRI
jgi:hypothetical protein